MSTRIEILLNSPLYGNILPAVEGEYFCWNLTNDKKLTVSYESTFNRTRIAIMETIALMLNKRNLSNLFTLTYRELESYLRDQNDIPAFDDPDAEVIFDQILSNLQSLFFNFYQSAISGAVSVIQENQYWMDVFSILEGMEFVLAEKRTLYFYKNRSDGIVSFLFSE